MKRILALVEGQTEEAFIGRCLAPHLWAHGVHVEPKIIVTRRVRSGPNFKGGVSSWDQVTRDLKLLLRDTDADAITTLLDYYGLPTDVPGMSTRPNGSAFDKVSHVQDAIDAAIGDPRLRSHLLLHEFEALLYADPDLCGSHLGNASLATVMGSAVASSGGPELVNDSPTQAPSKRILSAHAAYSKTLDGPALTEAIGLGTIRAACPHFESWMSWLENL